MCVSIQVSRTCKASKSLHYLLATSFIRHIDFASLIICVLGLRLLRLLFKITCLLPAIDMQNNQSVDWFNNCVNSTSNSKNKQKMGECM